MIREMTRNQDCVIGLSGRLFYYFVVAFANQKTQRTFSNAGDKEDATMWFYLLDSQRIPFYNFLINSIFNMSRFADKQVLMRNTVAEARGLSKAGRMIFAKVGMMLSERTYQRRMVSFEISHAARVRWCHVLLL